MQQQSIYHRWFPTGESDPPDFCPYHFIFNFLNFVWALGVFYQFNEEARSPFVKKFKTIIHPGEVKAYLSMSIFLNLLMIILCLSNFISVASVCIFTYWMWFFWLWAFRCCHSFWISYWYMWFDYVSVLVKEHTYVTRSYMIFDILCLKNSYFSCGA